MEDRDEKDVRKFLMGEGIISTVEKIKTKEKEKLDSEDWKWKKKQKSRWKNE